MPVVTISRGIYSGGEAIAEEVAARLGCRCISRDALVERAAAWGVPERELREALLKSPALLERLRPRRSLYLMLIQAALAEEAADGNAVYHGNAGHLLLRGAVPVARVRIIAPLEFRLAMLKERTGLDREEGAAYLARMDEERRNWARYLYDVDWGDASLYDLVINLEHNSVAEASAAVGDLAGLECFAFTPERRTAMRDFALASRVRAELGLDSATARLEVKVWCLVGVVHVEGFVGSQWGIRAVERVARAVPGIGDLNLDELTIYHDI